MNNKKNYENTTEENFLKNKAKRRKIVESTHVKKKPVKKVKAPVQKKARTQKKNIGTSKKVFKIIGIVIASILAAILAVALGFFIYTVTLDDNVENKNSLISGDTNAENRASADSENNNNTEGNIDIGNYKYYTFLATATDASGNLTDVIMVGRFHYPNDPEFEGPEVSVLQIPRDTYVRMASKLILNDDGTLSAKNFDPKSGTYATKINGVFAHGRSLASSYVTSLLKETDGKSEKEIEAICHSKEYKFLNADVEKIKKYHKAKESEKKEIKTNINKDFGITYLATLIYHYFGIPIDYQAQVNIAGFRGIVDAIGGVDLDVPQRMYYKDPYQDLYIDLYPGYQHLNGKKAEEFVRFRSYLRGDVDRLDAQKIFINAFLDKLLSPSIVTKIDKIIVEIQNNLYTGISFNDLLRFSRKVLKMDMSTDFALQTLPGVGDYVGNVSYFIAYKEESMALINEQFNVYDEPIEESEFKMIDYNDVVSKQKPPISSSTVIKEEEEAAENKEETDNKNIGAETTLVSPSDNSDSSENNEPEVENQPVDEQPEDQEPSVVIPDDENQEPEHENPSPPSEEVLPEQPVSPEEPESPESVDVSTENTSPALPEVEDTPEIPTITEAPETSVEEIPEQPVDYTTPVTDTETVMNVEIPTV